MLLTFPIYKLPAVTVCVQDSSIVQTNSVMVPLACQTKLDRAILMWFLKASSILPNKWARSFKRSTDLSSLIIFSNSLSPTIYFMTCPRL